MSKVFQTKNFNPIVDHNARFAKKNLELRIDTVDALLTYFENGGAITVCKAGRRNKANTSFPMIRGSVSHMGAKSNTLKTSGKAKGKNSA
jgi:hypothetical protein